MGRPFRTRVLEFEIYRLLNVAQTPCCVETVTDLRE